MKIIHVGMASIALIVGSTAEAGFRRDNVVSITRPSAAYMQVSGAMGFVHNTGDRTQLIGCEVGAWQTSSYAICYARDVVGTYVSCFTSNPMAITAALALGSDGDLTMIIDNNGTCQGIYPIRGSHTTPKAPPPAN